eukprot:TRINITY_DN3614_c0_g1_i1.p1 TRINITY_DN3614_c0_g1~~TRINITY_DN3614_c0_g1_i1.p1  ORF type:complete len:2040 (-),score=393.86 TRINITY_DN3614_c0_g1_i1:176-6295(-)
MSVDNFGGVEVIRPEQLPHKPSSRLMNMPHLFENKHPSPLSSSARNRKVVGKCRLQGTVTDSHLILLVLGEKSEVKISLQYDQISSLNLLKAHGERVLSIQADAFCTYLVSFQNSQIMEKVHWKASSLIEKATLVRSKMAINLCEPVSFDHHILSKHIRETKVTCRRQSRVTHSPVMVTLSLPFPRQFSGSARLSKLFEFPPSIFYVHPIPPKSAAYLMFSSHPHYLRESEDRQYLFSYFDFLQRGTTAGSDSGLLLMDCSDHAGEDDYSSLLSPLFEIQKLPLPSDNVLLEIFDSLQHIFDHHGADSSYWRGSDAVELITTTLYPFFSVASSVARTLQEGQSILLLHGDEHSSARLVLLLVQVMVDPACRTCAGFWDLFAFQSKLTDLYTTSSFYDPSLLMFVNTLFLNAVVVLLAHNPHQFEFSTPFIYALLMNSKKQNVFLSCAHLEEARASLLPFNQFKVFSEPLSQRVLPIPEVILPWYTLYSSGSVGFALNRVVLAQNVKRRRMEGSFESALSVGSLKGVSFTGYSRVSLVNASLIDIDEVSFGTMTRVTTLSLAGNFLTTLPRFSKLRVLTTLNLSRNPLYSVRSFSNIPTLHSLSLSDCELVSLAGLTGLPALSELNLDSNSIKEIPFSFKEFTALEYVNLGTNQLTYIARDILEAWTRLKTLNLSHNLFRESPVFDSNIRLETLHFSHNLLNNFPSCARCPLTRLDLSSNKLMVVPIELGEQRRLENLNLRQNELEVIPEIIHHCRALESVNLSQNSLTELPLKFYRLRKIVHLDLSQNRFQSLSLAIGQLQELNSLNVSYNRLTSLPLTIGSLSNIARLSIEGNELYHEKEILSYGVSALLTHLRDELESERNFRRAKLIVLGPNKKRTSHVVDSLNEMWTNPESSLGSTAISTALVSTLLLTGVGPPGKGPELEKEDSLDLLLKSDDGKGPMTKNYRFMFRSRDLKRKLPIKTKGTQAKKKANKTKKKLLRDREREKAREREIEKESEEILVSLWNVDPESIQLSKVLFSSSTLFVMALDLGSPTLLADIDYYIKFVKATVPNPTIVVVGTRLGALHELNESWATTITASYGFPAIPFTTKDPEMFMKFRMLVESTMLTLPSVGVSVPLQYQFYEDTLKAYAKTVPVPVITLKTARLLAESCGIANLSEMQKSTDLLHKQAEILYFRKVPALRDMIVLDPLWLIRMMESVGGTKSLNQGGFLSAEAQAKLWENFDRGYHPLLRTLLVNFDFAISIQQDLYRGLMKMIRADTSEPVETRTKGAKKKESKFMMKLIKRESTKAISTVQLTVARALRDDEGALLTQRDGPTSTSASPTKLGDVVPAANRSAVEFKVEDNYAFPQEKDASEECLLVLSLAPAAPKGYVDSRYNSLLAEMDYGNSYNRIVHFGFLPANLFGQIVFSALQKCEWTTGIWCDAFIGFSETAGVLLQSGYVNLTNNRIQTTLDYESTVKNAIRIDICGSNQKSSVQFLNLIIDCVIAELSRYSGLEFSSHVSVGDLFLPVLELEELINSGKMKYKSEGQKKLPITSFAPDLCFGLFAKKLVVKEELQLAFDGTDVPLGEGGFAKVVKGAYKGEPVAVKVMSLPTNFGRIEYLAVRSEMRHEITIQAQLDSPFIVRVAALCLNPFSVALEYCDSGDLQNFITDRNVTYKFPLMLELAINIATGLAYMHDQTPAVAHLDIKPPNVLLKTTPSDYVGVGGGSGSSRPAIRALLTDFGTSHVVPPTKIVERYVENPVWLAPEILVGLPYDEKVDTYAFGIVLWQMITRKAFFGDIQWISELEDMVVEGERPSIPSDCPTALRLLIQSCWTNEVDGRPPLGNVIEILTSICTSATKFASQGTPHHHHHKHERGKKKKRRSSSHSRNMSVGVVGSDKMTRDGNLIAVSSPSLELLPAKEVKKNGDSEAGGDFILEKKALSEDGDKMSSAGRRRALSAADDDLTLASTTVPATGAMMSKSTNPVSERDRTARASDRSRDRISKRGRRSSARNLRNEFHMVIPLPPLSVDEIKAAEAEAEITDDTSDDVSEEIV